MIETASSTTSPIDEPSNASVAMVDSQSQLKNQYGEDEFLEDVLKGFTSFTAEKLLALDDFCLVRYSLLLMSEIGWIGAHKPDSKEFTGLLLAFCRRAISSRPLKLRSALLTNTADLGLREFWQANLLYDPDCYDHSHEETYATECDSFEAKETFNRSKSNRSNASCNANTSILHVNANELQQDDRQLTEYVVNRFFHPKHGIQLKSRRYSCSHKKNSFSERSALLFLMQDLNISKKKTASELGKRMEELDLIERIRGRCVPRNVLPFGFGLTKYVQGSSLRQTLRKEPSVVAELSEHGKAKGVCISFGMDLLDLQSINFWTKLLWDQQLVEGNGFGTHAVIHPMAITSNIKSSAAEFNNRSSRDVHLEENQSGETSTLSYGGHIVHNIDIKKVFTSMAKPAILSLSSFTPGCIIQSSFQEGDQHVEKSVLEIMPQVIAKKGDNLIQDMSVSLMFSVFNHVWRVDADRFGGQDKVPFSFSYDVLPTGAKKGLLEVVTGLESLNHYDWKNWVAENRDSEEVLANMLRSTAGCSVAQYVLGCGDRHFDNIQIKDGETMLHIDFGMILGDNPPFKTPRFSISGDMEKAFREVGIWDPFLHLCGDAFLSLRSRSSELMRVIALLLKHLSRPRDKVLKYLASAESFNIDESSEDSASRLVRERVAESSTNWETIMRQFTHDKIDPLFFKATQMAPKPLVTAVEKMYDN